MRLLIVGAGAIGSLIGNRLAGSGNDVTLVGREKHVKAIRGRGLGLDERGKVRWESSVQAVTSVEEVADDSFDLIILAVKAYDTATAAAQATPLTERGISVLLLQNGVELDDLPNN